MSKKHKRPVQENAQEQRDESLTEQSAPPERHVTDAHAGEAADAAEAAEVVPESAEAQLQRELDALHDKYLRLAAEYDNYRKRIVRERAELHTRLRAELVKMMLEAIDDLSRVTEVDPETAAARDVIAGVELVERKLMRELEGLGLMRVGEPGETFDPNHHEAVGGEPAPHPEEEGVIATVLQPGYKLGDHLVRPARVRVYTEPVDEEDEANDAPGDEAQESVQ